MKEKVRNLYMQGDDTIQSLQVIDLQALLFYMLCTPTVILPDLSATLDIMAIHASRIWRGKSNIISKNHDNKKRLITQPFLIAALPAIL